MNKLLYMVGPTATRKTNLAYFLSRKFNGDIISADSRQAYNGMDIGTGKDIPKGFKKEIKTIGGQNIPYYKKNHICLWGYDLVNPDQDFSIAHFQKFFNNLVNHIYKQGRLPIIVGGSGFYLNSIETPPDSISVPQNTDLRKKLAYLSVDQLKNKLKKINLNKYSSLNQSDINNPRRLVRAIEISMFKNENQTFNKQFPTFDSLWIGLKTSKENLDENIQRRVQDRIKSGFEAEFNSLYKKGLIDRNYQSTASTGYRQWLEYKVGNISKNQAINDWTTAEKQYARRQLTWFKKQKNINWFDSNSKNIEKSVEAIVRVWYS